MKYFIYVSRTHSVPFKESYFIKETNLRILADSRMKDKKYELKWRLFKNIQQQLASNLVTDLF